MADPNGALEAVPAPNDPFLGTPEDDDPAVQTVGRGPRGPYFLAGGRTAAERRAQRLSDRLDVPLTGLRADAVSIEADTVQAMTLYLRDALWLRVRRLERVYEGRVISVAAAARTDQGGRMPPAVLDVTLATDEDRRALQLTGGFARAFLASGAQEGDIVQIAKDQSIVSLRRDRTEATGRVLEERDFVYRVRLGDRDRAWEPPSAVAATSDDERPPLPAPPRALYGTGRRPLPPLEALRATDAWVDRELTSKEVRLEAGVLLVADAGALDARVLALLREAVACGTSPIILLHDSEREAHERWARTFPEGCPLPGDD